MTYTFFKSDLKVNKYIFIKEENMNVNVAKLLCMISMKKAEDKSLSVKWIRCLHNLMQVNKTLLNFVRRKNYDNIHLKDILN